MKALRRLLYVLSRFPPRARIAMVLVFDLGLCTSAALLTYSLRVGEWRIFVPPAFQVVVITCATWLAVAPIQGVYRSLLRFSGARSLKDLAIACSIMAVIMTVLVVFLRVPPRVPRTLPVLVPIILFILLASSRLILSSLLRETLYARRRGGRRKVLIYGAGVAGRELALSIGEDPEFSLVGFIDDNPMLRWRRLEGCRIWHSSDLAELTSSQEIDEVLLAIPGASRSRRRQAVEEIRELAPEVGVRSLPNMAEIASGRVSVSDLREIQIEELLGRDQVVPDPELMAANVRGRSVMITGAGGSIGSELSRQILLERPATIVLAERSELALYLIDGELRELAKRHKLGVNIQCRLVDVADRDDIERVYRESRPQTVFHAAAYKHVPLVEADPIAGIRNNILGTYYCCLLAEEFGVENFTLVSTDKAVRPSSVMGASKRICELLVQSRAALARGVRYSAVRFGNVLGSSGSVVPLFRRQIAAGGPVTITHRDATRYFMTVSEAAQLVVQAGAMAKGGEIFLLDMGEPVRIRDLAAMMIQLSGLAVGGDDDRDGDIDIVEIGLRPGEKIHEELLVDNLGVPTSHPRIVRASESGFVRPGFEPMFTELLASLERRDPKAALAAVDALLAGERAIGTTGRKTVSRAPSRKKTASASIRAVEMLVPKKRAFE
jgi:FlaA1/EpsC-like NDP-sugar epimerase